VEIAGCEELRVGVDRVLVALGLALPRSERGDVAAATANAKHVQETTHAAGARRVVVIVVDRAEADAGRGAERGAGRGCAGHPDRIGFAASGAGNVVHQHVVAHVQAGRASVVDAQRGAVAGDRFRAEHVDTVEIDLVPCAAGQADADRVEGHLGKVAVTVVANAPDRIVDDGIAEVVRAGRDVDAKGTPHSCVVVLDIVHLVAADIGRINRRSQLDTGNIVVHRRGDLV